MTQQEEFDIVIVGAGPVGLMCAYLGVLCGLRIIVIDKSAEPLKVGRADALNARTLQLLKIAGLFDELYPLGKKCNTSSVWSNGKCISRDSSWWDELEGCLHKHFLMLGQSFIEQQLDEKLWQAGAAVLRSTSVLDVRITESGCLTTLSDGTTLQSSYVIGADGARSAVREIFKIPFELVRPQLDWAVIDGIIETDFPKVPEIIIFQAETADVAWIPREGHIDRFYVRMDTKNFQIEEAIAKISRALEPHTVRFDQIVGHSKFSVKESVAEQFSAKERVFLAGDACHIHSVNGGQGLNTGLGDAFNLMWKLNMVLNFGAPSELLETYEQERKPVALSVIEASGELVRSTKYSSQGAHAQDYVEIVRKRAGNVTGMGIRYGEEELCGTRLFDLEMYDGEDLIRLYSLLDYTRLSLLVFGDCAGIIDVPAYVKVIHIYPEKREGEYWSASRHYTNQMLLIRPDSYIQDCAPQGDVQSLFENIWKA
jgi:2-polyprenyl-6-methoxyphenol hydroxylase-like FAD-dependent oxidoreductase